MALNYKQLVQRRQAGNLGAKQKNRLQAMRRGELPKRPVGGVAGQGPAKNIKQGVQGVGTDILNTASNYIQPVAETAMKPLDFSAFGQGQDLAAERARIESSLYDNYTRNFADEQQRERDALEQRLAERGISPGSGDLYQNEMNRFDQSWQDRYDQAKRSAVADAGSEWKNAFNIGLAGHQQNVSDKTLQGTYGLSNFGNLLGLGLDTGGLGLGYAQLNQQKKQAEKDRQTQLQIAGMNRGGGGGGGTAPIIMAPPPPFEY